MVETLLSQCQADQAAPIGGHEVDRLGRRVFGTNGQIAFVLTIRIVDDDDHSTLAQFFQSLFDRYKGHDSILSGARFRGIREALNDSLTDSGKPNCGECHPAGTSDA